MKRVFFTKDEFNQRVGIIISETLDKTLDEKIRLLSAKEEYFSRWMHFLVRSKKFERNKFFTLGSTKTLTIDSIKSRSALGYRLNFVNVPLRLFSG